jgi:ubiquinone/menaquinone biosynthesis C-methylase UbiE
MREEVFNEKSVEQYYEEWTQKYIDDFGHIFQALQTDRPEELIEYMARVSGMADGKRILDAGSGIGGPSIIWAKNYHVQIDALTISPTQAALTKENIAKETLKGKISVTIGDFHKLENYFPENSFDAVYFLESLVHSHDPAAVIRSVRQVLKQHGIIYIKDLFVGPNDPAHPGQTDYPIKKIEEQFALRIRKSGDILNTLAENGFQIEFCRQPEVQRNFDRGNLFTAKHLLKLLPDQTGPWMDQGLTFLHWLEIRAERRY